MQYIQYYYKLLNPNAVILRHAFRKRDQIFTLLGVSTGKGKQLYEQIGQGTSNGLPVWTTCYFFNCIGLFFVTGLVYKNIPGRSRFVDYDIAFNTHFYP